MPVGLVRGAAAPQQHPAHTCCLASKAAVPSRLANRALWTSSQPYLAEVLLHVVRQVLLMHGRVLAGHQAAAAGAASHRAAPHGRGNACSSGCGHGSGPPVRHWCQHWCCRGLGGEVGELTPGYCGRLLDGAADVEGPSKAHKQSRAEVQPQLGVMPRGRARMGVRQGVGSCRRGWARALPCFFISQSHVEVAATTGLPICKQQAAACDSLPDSVSRRCSKTSARALTANTARLLPVPVASPQAGPSCGQRCSVPNLSLGTCIHVPIRMTSWSRSPAEARLTCFHLASACSMPQVCHTSCAAHATDQHPRCRWLHITQHCSPGTVFVCSLFAYGGCVTRS